MAASDALAALEGVVASSSSSRPSANSTTLVAAGKKQYLSVQAHRRRPATNTASSTTTTTRPANKQPQQPPPKSLRNNHTTLRPPQTTVGDSLGGSPSKASIEIASRKMISNSRFSTEDKGRDVLVSLHRLCIRDQNVDKGKHAPYQPPHTDNTVMDSLGNKRVAAAVPRRITPTNEILDSLAAADPLLFSKSARGARPDTSRTQVGTTSKDTSTFSLLQTEVPPSSPSVLIDGLGTFVKETALGPASHRRRLGTIPSNRPRASVNKSSLTNHSNPPSRKRLAALKSSPVKGLREPTDRPVGSSPQPAQTTKRRDQKKTPLRPAIESSNDDLVSLESLTATEPVTPPVYFVEVHHDNVAMDCTLGWDPEQVECDAVDDNLADASASMGLPDDCSMLMKEGDSGENSGGKPDPDVSDSQSSGNPAMEGVMDTSDCEAMVASLSEIPAEVSPLRSLLQQPLMERQHSGNGVEQRPSEASVCVLFTEASRHFADAECGQFEDAESDEDVIAVYTATQVPALSKITPLDTEIPGVYTVAKRDSPLDTDKLDVYTTAKNDSIRGTIVPTRALSTDFRKETTRTTSLPNGEFGGKSKETNAVECFDVKAILPYPRKTSQELLEESVTLCNETSQEETSVSMSTDELRRPSHSKGIPPEQSSLQSSSRRPLSVLKVKASVETTEEAASDQMLSTAPESEVTEEPRRVRRNRAQPARLGTFASEQEIERRLHKKNKLPKSSDVPVSSKDHALSLTNPDPTSMEESAVLPDVPVKPETRSSSDCNTHIPESETQRPRVSSRSKNSLLPSAKMVNSSSAIGESLPVVLTGINANESVASNEKKPNPSPSNWTESDLFALRVAHRSVEPTSPVFWFQVASGVPGKSEEQCRSKWFALIKTPAAKRAAPPKRITLKQGDDFFDSTPFRHGPELAVDSPLRNLDLGSAIKMDTDEICGIMAVRMLTNDEDDENDPLNLHTHLPRGTKSHIQNLKREMGKAIAVQRKKDKRNKRRNQVGLSTGGTVKQIPRMPRFFTSQEEMGLKARVSDGGTVQVHLPVEEEDDFWDELDEENERG